MSPAERIIVPLDVPTTEQAIALVDNLPEVTFWKVGLELFVSTGPALLQHLKDRQKRIFLDLKFHDIPNTMAGACRAAAGYGVDLLTVHSTAGQAALKRSQAAAQEGATQVGCQPPQLIAITLLTSLSARVLASELKVPLELSEYALNMALLSRDSGLGGAVCSPQEATKLRQACGENFTLVCPGVRPEWAESGDQRRSLTPAETLKAGADYLVIGRPITQADSPSVAFQRICQELEGIA
jgi:orotidine-5'-phosphate decarboxylase